MSVNRSTDAAPMPQDASRVPWLFAGLTCAGSLAFYLLLAGSLAWTEWAAAVPCAGGAGAFMTIQHLRQTRPMRLPRPPARMVAASLLGLVSQTGRIGLALLRALVRPVEGEARWQAFHPGGIDPRDAGRRALVTLLTSATPNGIVLDLRPSAMEEADHGLLLHRLVPGAPLSDRDWPA